MKGVFGAAGTRRCNRLPGLGHSGHEASHQHHCRKKCKLFVHWEMGVELGRFVSLLVLAGNCLLTLNPAIHLSLKNRQRHSPVFQHLIVEGPDVESYP